MINEIHMPLYKNVSLSVNIEPRNAIHHQRNYLNGFNSQIMSNGVYNSIEHRATVNAMKERISLAMFFNPKLEANVGPAKSLLKNTRDPPLYKTLVMEQYLTTRN